MLNNSKVTGPEGSYTIFMEHGSTFAAVNNTIENAGWMVKEFKGNALHNIASVRFYSSGNVVEDNVVIGMRHERIAFIGSNDNVMGGNVFMDGSLTERRMG